MGDRGAPGSAELIGGGLEVVRCRVDEPNRPAGRPEELDAVRVPLGEELDDRAFRADRTAADVTAQPYAVVEFERRSHATAAARST
jgi:hypothetical protein